MGTYLSTPVLDKCVEIGSSNENGEFPVAWAVADMQGWRKSMEDAHIATADVNLPGGFKAAKRRAASDTGDPPRENDGESEMNATAGGDEKAADSAPAPMVVPDRARIFAVFDGHGGPEVARFCQLYLVDVLTKSEGWTGPPTKAETKSEGAERAEDGGEGNKMAESDSEGGGNSGSPEDELNRRVGEALVDCFHAVDRMIDDPGRRDEISLLRVEKPRPGETRTVLPSASPWSESHSTTATGYGASPYAIPPAPAAPVGARATATSLPEVLSEKEDGGKENAGGESKSMKEAAPEQNGESPSDGDKDKASPDPKGEVSSVDADSDEVMKDTEEDGAKKVDPDTPVDGDATEEDAITGKDESESDSGDEGGEKGGMGVSAVGAVSLFRKLLTGQAVTAEGAIPNGDANNQTGAAEAAGQVMGPSVTQPTRVQNGRQVCNLPDHPVHAGCTSVVAVLAGNTLTVANAGDSRAVLCREGGKTEPLSFDHKPMQERERSRIAEAGGFVNQFGRVNGNLNLSRSIGDLKYKQVPGIPPSGQMITAEPDITQVTVNPGRDEFLVLGCDGIWDCLTNEEAVKYVRDRIDSKTPVEIAREVLDEIVSEDPRASQGIGGDNMTLLIVDLLPQTRPYYNHGGVVGVTGEAGAA